MGIVKRRSHRSGRAPLPSPGRPPVAGRFVLQRFGWGSRRERPARMLLWRPGCRSLSEPDCSDWRVAWPQQCSDLQLSRRPSGIFRLRSVKRSHSFAFRVFQDARSAAALADPPRPSPVSYVAMQRRAAAAWSIVHRQLNGTPSDRLVGPSRPSLRSTQPCALMWSRDWPAWS
jgi:hypothetical protein